MFHKNCKTFKHIEFQKEAKKQIPKEPVAQIIHNSSQNIF